MTWSHDICLLTICCLSLSTYLFSLIYLLDACDQWLPGYKPVFFPFMIAFVSCMIAAVLIIVFYREKVTTIRRNS